jgi:hypothetical protein
MNNFTNHTKLILEDNTLKRRYGVLNTTYGIMVSYPLQDITLHYKTSVVFNKVMANGSIITINREQLYINDALPDKMVYEIADVMAKCFYPIQLHITFAGEILAIKNYDEIVTRCKEALPTLQAFGEGDIIDTLVANFKRSYANMANIITELQQDVFFQLYFLPIHITYGLRFTESIPMAFVFDKNQKPVQFVLKAILDKQYTRSGKIKVALQNDPLRQKGQHSFKGFYRLHPEHHNIYMFNVNIHIQPTKGEPFEMKYELYELENT